MKRFLLSFLMIFALLIAVGCSNNSDNNTDLNNDYFAQYEYVKLNYGSLLNMQKEDEVSGYYVYFYSNECHFCETIKDEVLSYLDNNINGVRLYLFEINSKNAALLYDGSENMLGVSNVQDLKILGTPTIIYVENNMIVYGETSNKAVLNALENPKEVVYKEDVVIDYYENYTHLKLDYEDILNVKTSNETSDYYVYFYSNDCYNCRVIAERILRYLNDNDIKTKLYLFEIDAENNDLLLGYEENITNVSDVNELKLIGFPSVVYAKDGVAIYGKTSLILQQLKLVGFLYM